VSSAKGRGRSPEAGPRRRPTINDIARLASVSKKTVSRVINNSPFVGSDTRDKVQAVIREHGYAPDPQARGLSLRRSFLIGLIYDNPDPQYVVNMQLGLKDGMRESSFELMVHPCDRSSPTFLEDLRSFVERQKLDGVVLTPPVSEDERAADLLRQIGCEYVRIAPVSLDEPRHMVETRDRLGGRAAGLHLAALGHTRIGYISGPQSVGSTRERRIGFEDGLAEHGVSLGPELVFEGSDTFESGIAGGEALLAVTQRPTAIFADNDEMAAGVLHAARRAGLEIPRELSVVGFEESRMSAWLWPPLTTVRTHTRHIGRLAVLQLMGKQGDRGRDDEGRLPVLVERASSGPAPA
jgi:LacI family transcriptional regulator